MFLDFTLKFKEVKKIHLLIVYIGNISVDKDPYHCLDQLIQTLKFDLFFFINKDINETLVF